MDLLYTFYGDDFTGSTDVLERLATHGVPAVLFLAPPTDAQRRAFPDVRAIGVAGDSRSRSPEWMSANLPAIFSSLAALNAPILQYKVCSTFDSSPTLGSIGRAMEIGLDLLHPRFIPIVVGAPHLRRFVYEGRLFAAAPDGIVHRIDRHPMRHHPATPMREPDLRRHLAEQTALRIGLVDHEALSKNDGQPALNEQLAQAAQAVLFDTIDDSTLNAAGRLIWREALRKPLFSASSSGLTAALINAWKEDGLLSADVSKPNAGLSSPLLVLSGSCSVATERQIRWALDHGFQGISLDAHRLLEEPAAEQRTAIEAARQMLSSGKDTVLYTSLGSPQNAALGDRLGAALGNMLLDLLRTTNIRRAVVCGGDTSSHAVQQLGVEALTWKANLQPGAPLCQAHGPEFNARPLELVLKGGQMGTDDFFAVVRAGSSR